MTKQGIRRIIVIIFICAFSAALIWINDIERTELMENDGRSFERAEVTEVVQDNIQASGQRVGQQKIKVRIKSGVHEGEILSAVSSSSYLYGADCREGLDVIVIISETDSTIDVSVYNYDRGMLLYGIVVLFLAVLWVIGGRKGLNSAIGLVFTFVCIIFMFLPLIYRGVSPIFAAVMVVVLTTVVVTYLINGISKKSLCAMLGTVSGVVMAAVFALIFGRLAHISGYNVSDVESLMYIQQVTDIRVGELMFAGILISALGAVMDVAVSVASTINEIHERKPELGRYELFRSGMNVGRDMMGTMSNTLILAFAGSSINMLVYIYSYKYSYYQVLNMYDVGIEIIQGIAATLGVILTVPFVAFISAAVISSHGSSHAVSRGKKQE